MSDEKLKNGTVPADKSVGKAVESPPAQLSEADLNNIMEHLSDDEMGGVAAGGEA
jgi:hypothetical protein